MDILFRENVVNVLLTSKDKAMLTGAIDLLGRLQERLKDNETIVNTATGECICANELPRVRGLIDGLLNGNEWEIEKD